MPVSPLVLDSQKSEVMVGAYSDCRYPASQIAVAGGPYLTFTDPSGVGSKIVIFTASANGLVNITVGLNGVAAVNSASSVTAVGVGYRVGAVAYQPISIITTRNDDKITSIKAIALSTGNGFSVCFADPIAESPTNWAAGWSNTPLRNGSQ